MSVNESAKKAAKIAARNTVESTTLMEPMLLSLSSIHRPKLTDKALSLTAASVGLHQSLPPGISRSLRRLLRSMNCYYSNLIEGHDTHPIDIERALQQDYSKDVKKRDLQLEARAHIEVQKWIDDGNLEKKFYRVEGILEVHRRFCELLPEELLWVENPETKEKIKVIPGEVRHRDVRVGKHIPVSAAAVSTFLDRFEEAYQNLGVSELVLSAAAAHHRLVWIHPFLDGNGRVARLISYAAFLHTIDTGGLWSIARGLARNLEEYKRHLMACDEKRRGDLDGRGNLSEETLAEFTAFYLDVCLDQVQFMKGLLEPSRFRDRILNWVQTEIRLKTLPPKASILIESILYRGELSRDEIPGIIDMSERSARRVVSDLIDRGILESASIRAPLRLVFSATLAAQWFPGLFPDKREE